MGRTVGCLSEIDVVILAGGRGTRLQPVVADLPKILAPIAGKPMLDWLLNWLRGFGARRVILSLGYMAEAVEHHVAEEVGEELEVILAIEPKPLGTGGALKFAGDYCQSNPVLVVNGATLVNADLCSFLAVHRRAGTEISLVCAREGNNPARFGRVEIARDRVISFHEKDPSWTSPTFVSAGVYLFSPAAIAAIPGNGAPSLECDILGALPSGEINAYSDSVSFLAIGTPASFVEAEEAMRKGKFGE